MAKKPTSTLPNRFQPYANQAATETAIKYGPQQTALQQAYNDTTYGYQQGLAAQKSATQSLLGALQAAPAQVDDVYADAGLTPSVLTALAASPGGSRLAAELARAKTGLVQQQAGARAGAIYQVGHLTDQYNQDVGKINTQAQALAAQSGADQSNLLDQLIGQDRSTRHDANQHAADQQFTADQNSINDANSLTKGLATGLIGQGVTPVIGPDGSVSAGGAIPGAKSSKPKKVATATHGEQNKAESEFSRALRNAQAAIGAGADPNSTLAALTTGRKAAKGQPLFDTVPVKDQYGNDTGQTKQVRRLNKDGTPATKGGKTAVDPVDPAIAQAAVDMATNGYLKPATVKALHALGYNVSNLPGVVTWNNRPKGTNVPVAPGANGQNRPG